MKKISRLISVFVLALTSLLLVSCGGDNTEIAILVPGATHGWPVGVVYYAGESAKELEKDGYKVKVLTAETPADQINQIDDLITLKSLKGIAILPFDDTLKTGLQKIADAKIPFVQFDRIIDDVKSDAKVMGDNPGIGSETARVFVEKGLTPGAKVLEMPGDESSVPTMRSNGFRDYLTSEAEWTTEDLASIHKTDFTGWSRETSDTIFENWIDGLTQEQLNEYEYIFTHDDEIAQGVMDVMLRTNNKTFDHIKVLASSAGQQAYYKILDSKPANGWFNGKLPNAYLFSVTYPPYMIQDTVDALMDVLAGKKVDETLVIKVEIVDSTNAKNFLNPDSPY